MNALRYAGQAAFYAALAAFVGYFSTAPRYHHLAPGQSLLKLSLVHAGQRKAPCHERSAEELARLAPNMRAPSVCPRARVPLTVEVALDGAPLFRVVAPASGLAHDGAATIYRRIAIPAGEHRITARLADAPDGAFRVSADTTVQLAPGKVLVIDFEPGKDAFLFRS